jgi:hypothetical protein
MRLVDGRWTGSKWIARLAGLKLCVHDISTAAMRNPGLATRYLEAVVAALQVGPERKVGVITMLRHILRRHAEGKSLNLKGLLAALQSLARDGVDLGDPIIG